MIPTINTKGNFTFAAPYDTLVSSEQQLTVLSARALSELVSSGEDPLTFIYTTAGVPDSVYEEDLNNNAVIITFLTTAGEYIYVPENKVLSDTILTGVPYVEHAILVNLGYLPVGTDLTTLIGLITDTIYDNIGVSPSIVTSKTSSIVNVTNTKHQTLSNTRNNNASVTKSYKTLYTELLELHTAQAQLIANIEQVQLAQATGV